MNEERRQMQQALQEALDRRDNGGPAGMVSQPAQSPAQSNETERSEPPVSEWARVQLQHAFN